jgi:hypothetical protein
MMLLLVFSVHLIVVPLIWWIISAAAGYCRVRRAIGYPATNVVLILIAVASYRVLVRLIDMEMYGEYYWPFFFIPGLHWYIPLCLVLRAIGWGVDGGPGVPFVAVVLVPGALLAVFSSVEWIGIGWCVDKWRSKRGEDQGSGQQQGSGVSS